MQYISKMDITYTVVMYDMQFYMQTHKFTQILVRAYIRQNNISSFGFDLSHSKLQNGTL